MGKVLNVFGEKKLLLLFLFSGIISSFVAVGQTDTFHVFFPLNDPMMNRESTQLIDSMIYTDRINTAHDILIIGYADYLGSEKYNKGLSEHRAENVKAYLGDMGMDVKKITLCVGKGKIDRNMKSPEGFAPDRRVDVVILNAKKRTAVKQTAPVQTVKQPAASAKQVRALDTLQVGQTYTLNNIYFYAGRHTVREESLPELENLYNFMADNPTVRIQIEGHICCVKNAADALDEGTFELALSENRAKFIYTYLLRKGIENWRMAYRGFGRSRPVVAVEKTEEDENKNRRVEIRIMDK